ncbi:MAG: hypothetical protein COA79_22790 [Planctomycetota bacterium]|nr:MAG: hypothetical protein COA79_22790 [Planctomycetota bacterium]
MKNIIIYISVVLAFSVGYIIANCNKPKVTAQTTVTTYYEKFGFPYSFKFKIYGLQSVSIQAEQLNEFNVTGRYWLLRRNSIFWLIATLIIIILLKFKFLNQKPSVG